MVKNFERLMVWAFVSMVIGIVVGFYLVNKKQDNENWSSKGVVIRL